MPGLQLPQFCQRYAAFVADHDVIQRAHAHQVQRFLELMGQLPVGIAGLRIARGVVVDQNHRRRVVLQGKLDHFPRVDVGPVQGAAEQFVWLPSYSATKDVFLTVVYELRKNEAGRSC